MLKRETDFTRVNQPESSWSLPNVGELWRYRYALNELISRQLKIRYKQTILGVSWAVINPIVSMLVFTLVFGRFAEVPSYNIPYPLFNLAALVPWTLFSRGIMTISVSVVSNANLYTKVYVPRLIPPVAALFTGIIDYFVALVLLLLLMLGSGYLPTAKILLLPCFTLLAMVTALGFGLWLAAMHVRFRDVGQAIPFLVQIGMYLTPVAYPSSLVTAPWRTVYQLNPMVTVVEGFRWALFDVTALDPTTSFISIAIVLITSTTGILFFQHVEGTFADII